MTDVPESTSDLEISTGPDPKPPLTVVIGADTFAPEINGSATFSASLAAGLARRGHTVHIVAPAGSYRGWGTYREVHAGEELTVHRLFSARWYPHPWLRFALPWRIQKNSARILDEVKPDVVHFQSNIVVGRGLSEQALKRGIRLIATNHVMPENLLEHSPIPERFQEAAVKAYWASAEKIYGRAQAMTTPTRRAADYLEQNTNLRGVIAISCGIDAHKYTPSFEPRTENLIVFVGRVTGEKQIDVLIKAFARLDPSLRARLEIVGGGEIEHQLKHLAQTLGVADRVTFAGYVSDEYLRNALTRATVFAMPSIAELQSIATMEALASALPVVGANAMALPHLVHDGENGYLFEPGNVDEMAARLTDVLTMPEDELQKFKRESLSIVQAHDIQRTLATFEALYRGEQVTEPLIEEPLRTRSVWRERLAARVRNRRAGSLAAAERS
ncbi:glycosyltransferase [Galbitalea soli]|uniref:glycosyltransferase n=1 Tax=Galbitalea soli TaxID=1268042 RepID=UPI0017E7D8FA|nr:glycosyltransferase involved in cell wall biosynthesis [Galbitalea soli]